MALNTDGALSFDAVIQNTQFKRQIDEIERRIRGLAVNTEKETGRMDTAFRRVAAGIGAYFSVQALSGFTRELIRVRGEFEQFDVAIQTILGNKARADALTAQVIDLAATTPFQLTDITKATQQLLAYGSVAEDIADEITMLGDVASGVSQPIGDLVYLYGTLRTQGRAYTRDILQFTSRGVPIIHELANVLGVAESQVQKLVEAGRVGFPEIEQAFRNMTQEGGIFAGLMERQSATIVGQLANLRDQWDQMLNEIGESTQGVFSGAISTARTLIEHYEEIGKAIAVIITTYGAYRAAVVAVTLAKRADAFITTKAIALQKLELLQGRALTLEQARRLVQQRLLTVSNLKLMASQLKLNAVMLANPYVLAATAVVGLTAAIIAYSKRLTTAERAQRDFNKAMQDGKDRTGEQIDAAQEHIRVIKDETETLFAQLKAREQLLRTFPDLIKNMSVEEIRLISLEEWQRKFNETRDEREIEQARKYYQEQIALADELRKKLEEAVAARSGRFSNAGFYVDTSVILLRQQLERAEAAAETAKEALDKLLIRQFEANATDEEKLARYEQQRDVLQHQVDQLQEMTKAAAKFPFYFDDAQKSIGQMRLDFLIRQLDEVNRKINQLVKPREQRTVAEEIDRLQQSLAEQQRILSDLRQPTAVFDLDAIEKAEAEIKSITDQLRALGVEGEKSAPFGSLKYWEDVAKRAEEIISLTPRENEAEIRKQQEIKTKAEQKAEEIRQLIAKRSFDEELEYKRKQYELYQRWIQFTSQEAADEQFATLIADGKGYVDFLQRQIKKLQAKIDSGAASNTEIEQFQTLNIELQDATGAQSKIDLFRDKLEQAKEEAISLTDYIKRLREEQDKLAGDRTDFGFSARGVVAVELQEAERERAKLLQQFIQDTQTTEQRELQIVQNFNDLRAEANRQYLQGRLKDREAVMNKIAQAEQEALAAERARVAESGEFYQKLFGDIVNYGVRSLRELADQTQAVLDSARRTQSADGQEYFLVDIPALNEEGEVVKKQVKLTLEDFIRFQNQIIAIQGEIRTKNPFVAIGESWKEMQRAFAEGDDADISRAINEFNASISEATSKLSEWGRTLSKVLGEDAARAIDTLGQLAEGLASIGAGIASKNPVSIIDGVVKVIGALGDVLTRGKQIAEENRKIQQLINELQREFNLLLNERIRLQESAYDSVFIDDWVNSLQQAHKAIDDANQAFQDLLKVTDVNLFGISKTLAGDAASALGDTRDATIEEFLRALKVQTGWKRGGFLGLGKPDAVFGSLLEAFPELIQNGEFMVAEAEKLLSIMGDLLPEETKEALQALIDWTKQAEEAQKQIESVIESIAGRLGNELRDALVTAFEEGTDAAMAFGDAVEGVLEDIISSQIFNAVFGPALKHLQEDIIASFDPVTGDQSLTDDFAKFFAQVPELIDSFNEGLEEAQRQAKRYGFDLFESTVDTADKTLTGGIKSVSEETAGIIAGQMNAIRINQAENLRLVRQSLLYQAEIASNTRYNRHLESIDRKLDALQNNPLRAQGLG